VRFEVGDRTRRPRGSLSAALATRDGKRRYVGALFATIADRYDLITVLLSYGRDRHWKRRVVELAAPRRDARTLDLATGTGDLALLLADRARIVVGLDITTRMIELARAKASGRPGLSPLLLVGDMGALPFASESFDLVTTGYGLRNVPDLSVAVDEILRVLRPGGQALSLDFNRPENPVVRGLYLRYLSLVGGALGWALHGDPDTYRYIPASIRQFPGADAVARLMTTRGFSRVRHHPVLGGLMAIHQAYK
jgi:demethylmenaquinone methyltransferase/2-methoxy-6-polyprenyl-1,4-benzoquinol methylase